MTLLSFYRHRADCHSIHTHFMLVHTAFLYVYSSITESCIPNTLHWQINKTFIRALVLTYNCNGMFLCYKATRYTLFSCRRRRVMTPPVTRRSAVRWRGVNTSRGSAVYSVRKTPPISQNHKYIPVILSMDTWIKWSSLSFQINGYAADFILRL